MAIPKTGDTAADFEVKDSEGQVYRLSELVTKGPVVLAFFPKAFTPGWTRQFSAYRDVYAEFQTKNTQILAVSTDTQSLLAKFQNKLETPFAFVPDPEGELTRLYGVKTPLVTFAKRYTFVIGKDRKVLQVVSGRNAVDPTDALQACSLYWNTNMGTYVPGALRKLRGAEWQVDVLQFSRVIGDKGEPVDAVE